MAMHTPGYTHFVEGNRTISTPRTITSNPSDGLLVPKPALKALRTELSKLYPELAEKPFTGTRLCWYNDTPDENWVIGYYPRDKGLIIATGGSGHAYKFLPVLGRIVADLVEDKLEAELIKKFAVDREIKKVDVWRLGQLIPLNVEDLCRPEDLQP